ncbi:MAG: AraC family transcriptional regulator [Propionibacteriaceae bacterium]
MSGFCRFTISDAPQTRIGCIHLAGEIVNQEPVMPRGTLRVVDEFALSLVLEGEGTFRYADGRTEPIRPRSLTMVPPREPHWYGTAPGQPWTELFAMFNGPLFEMLRDSDVLNYTGPRRLAAGANSNALAMILATQPRSMAAAEHQLLTLAEWLTSAFRAESGEDPICSHAAQRLTSDFTEKVDLQELARELGLGYDAFRRRFTAEYGLSPLAYRNTRRLETAATQLRLTAQTTREIAARLGYTDEFHFSRRFRSQFGVPPSTYRKSRPEPGPAPVTEMYGTARRRSS